MYNDYDKLSEPLMSVYCRWLLLNVKFIDDYLVYIIVRTWYQSHWWVFIVYDYHETVSKSIRTNYYAIIMKHDQEH